MKERIWEIDFIRALAICLMIVGHFVFDLSYILGVEVNFASGFWYWYFKAWVLFLFISGVSTGFSRRVLQRAIKLLAVALIISIVTYFLVGEEYIRFGILHFLALCMILHLGLSKLNVWLLGLLAVGIALLTPIIHQTSVDTSLLLPLGFTYPGFKSLDYFPLFPYLLYYILGIIAYKLYYYKGRSLFKFRLQSRVIEKISKNSLLIYVVHQPLLMGLIMLYKYLR